MPRRNPAFAREIDVRELPSYGITEAAHYLRIPRTTIRDWVTGRYYHGMGGRRFSKPIIPMADPRARLLSFMNLVEIHVLDAIRREHNIPLEKVEWPSRICPNSFLPNTPWQTENSKQTASISSSRNSSS